MYIYSINLQLCNYRYAYVIASHFYITGTVVQKDSLIIVVKDAPITAKPKFSVYEPLFEFPSVDAITKAMITGICGGNSECAYDIAVTGNVDVGRETLKNIKDHMIIVNQTLPSVYCIMLLYYVVVSVLKISRDINLTVCVGILLSMKLNSHSKINRCEAEVKIINLNIKHCHPKDLHPAK